MDLDLAVENSYPTPYANTSFLPLLFWSLMQQKHSPNTKKTFKYDYDFIIVGAGSAGSVVASRLSEIPCVSVLLLEAGKAPPRLTEVPILATYYWGTDISWFYTSVPQKNSGGALINNQVTHLIGKALGGSSILNGMLYTRGNRHNYDDWAKGGAVGWSYSDVLPYFYKLEDNTDPRYTANGYHVVGGPVTVSEQKYKSEIVKPILEAGEELGYSTTDVNGRNPTGFYDAQVTVRNGQRCSTAKSYLVPAENRTNLDIVTEALVKKVIIENGRAVGVVFDHGGKSHTVRAKREVIVSASSINTAKLLMLSGIGPKEHLKKMKIPVFADLPVGKNFHDHTGAAIYFELDPNIPNINQKLKNATNVQDYIKNRRGPLSASVANPLAFLTSPSNFRLDFPDYEIFSAETTAPVPNPNYGIKPEIVKKYFGPYENSSLFICLSLAIQPKSRGTIQLQSSNPYDPPVIDPNFFDHPGDVRSVVEGLKTCQKLGTSEPMRRRGSKPFPVPFPGCERYYRDEDRYFECLARATILSMYHQVGTCKMGNPDDPTTVVDPTLRVKGIDGLRVVDASVMPIIPAGNTNVPTIMVAEKASDLIKSTLNCYTQTPV